MCAAARTVAEQEDAGDMVEHLGCHARVAGGVKAAKPAPPSPGENLPSVALTAKAMEGPESGRRLDRWRRREGPGRRSRQARLRHML